MYSSSHCSFSRLTFRLFIPLQLPAAVNGFFENTVGAILGDGQATSRGSGGGAVAPRGVRQREQQLPQPPEDSVVRLVEMGFDRARAVRALQLSNNDVDQAIGLLLH